MDKVMTTEWSDRLKSQFESVVVSQVFGRPIRLGLLEHGRSFKVGHSEDQTSNAQIATNAIGHDKLSVSKEYP